MEKSDEEMLESDNPAPGSPEAEDAAILEALMKDFRARSGGKRVSPAVHPVSPNAPHAIVEHVLKGCVTTTTLPHRRQLHLPI
jgi:hypothetical protein